MTQTFPHMRIARKSGGGGEFSWGGSCMGLIWRSLTRCPPPRSSPRHVRGHAIERDPWMEAAIRCERLCQQGRAPSDPGSTSARWRLAAIISDVPRGGALASITSDVCPRLAVWTTGSHANRSLFNGIEADRKHMPMHCHDYHLPLTKFNLLSTKISFGDWTKLMAVYFLFVAASMNVSIYVIYNNLSLLHYIALSFIN